MLSVALTGPWSKQVLLKAFRPAASVYLQNTTTLRDFPKTTRLAGVTPPKGEQEWAPISQQSLSTPAPLHSVFILSLDDLFSLCSLPLTFKKAMRSKIKFIPCCFWLFHWPYLTHAWSDGTLSPSLGILGRLDTPRTLAFPSKTASALLNAQVRCDSNPLNFTVPINERLCT